MPLGDRVLVRPIIEKERTASGIYIPETAKKEKSEQGEVVGVGEGWYTPDGKLVPLKVKKGDKVVFSKYGYDEIKIDGEDYVIVKQEHILAIIK